jgi:hypothetical protein
VSVRHGSRDDAEATGPADLLVGRLLDYLEETGQLDNTATHRPPNGSYPHVKNAGGR